MSRDFHGEIRKAASEFEALRAKIQEMFLRRDESAEVRRAWAEACSAWHSYRSILDTFWDNEALRRLEAGDPDLIELAIAYVEVDPYYFRSGYLKKRLFRRLRRTTVSDAQKIRIQQGILKAIPVHQGSGWWDFCGLATGFWDADFLNKISGFATSDEPVVAMRAKTLLKKIQWHQANAV